MTQEQKDLLFKDLCARLPYGVKCIEKTPIEDFQDKNLWKIDRIRADAFMFGMSNCYVCYGQYDDIHNIKPYLFPLSSMTEEQYWEMQKQSGEDCLEHMEILKNFRNNTDFSNLPLYEYKVIDWFHKNHFDYRGLIPMGLAEDATGLNIY